MFYLCVRCDYDHDTLECGRKSVVVVMLDLKTPRDHLPLRPLPAKHLVDDDIVVDVTDVLESTIMQAGYPQCVSYAYAWTDFASEKTSPCNRDKRASRMIESESV